MAPAPLVELEGVTRRFGDLVAVEGASIALFPGEIHAIVGENGAGKSTLLKVAAGALAPSLGRVLVGGAPLDPPTVAEAARRGVGLVYQHFMLVPSFRALENLVLGSEPTDSLGRLDLAAAERRARELMESAGLDVPLHATTEDLSVGERQKLEILRVLFRGARAVLLDEPTAVLSPLEAAELYALLGRLARGGSAVTVVTHRLDEVVRFADRVTVMRTGKIVLSRFSTPGEASAAAEEELTRAIMGAEPPPPFARSTLAEGAPVVLAVRGLSLEAAAGRRVLDGVDLEVRAGEIVGVAGVEGNGQRELVRALAGLEPRATGEVSVGRAKLAGGARERRAVLAVVHEDRHAEGLLLDASVGDNLVLGDLGDPRREPLDERAVVTRRLQRFEVRPADAEALARELSGGNQQKVVVARALDRLSGQGAAVLAQPTRGVDVGAAATIHEAIGAAARAGDAVLVLSADLRELKAICHRIVVLRRGKLVADLPPTASDETFGRVMLGLEAA
jgi:simple sugar transport system ATP-binding protein